MKKIIAIVVILLLMLGLCACKSKKVDEDIAVSASESDAVKGSDKENDIDKPAQEQSTETSADEQQSNTVIDQPDITTNTDAEDTDNQKEVETDSPDAPVTNEQTSETPTLNEETAATDKERPLNDKTQVIIKIDSDNRPLETIEDISHYPSADVFVGKIISKEEIVTENNAYKKRKKSKGPITTEYFFIDPTIESVYYAVTGDLYVYTVEVEKTVNSVFVEQGTTIKVIADALAVSKPYVEGESYLMYGVLYEYHGETVLALTQMFAARVDDNGVLEGIGCDAMVMNELKTVDEFIANDEIQKIFKRPLNIATEYKRGYGLARGENLMDEKNKPILDSIIADGKKAIIAGSKVKMKIDTEAK